MSRTVTPPILHGSATGITISLTWDDPAEVGSYNVYYGTASGVYTPVSIGITNTWFQLSDIATAQTYYFVVTSVSKGVESTYSNVISVTTSVPSNFYVIKHTDLGQLYFWNGSSYQLKFIVKDVTASGKNKCSHDVPT